MSREVHDRSTHAERQLLLQLLSLAEKALKGLREVLRLLWLP